MSAPADNPWPDPEPVARVSPFGSGARETHGGVAGTPGALAGETEDEERSPTRVWRPAPNGLLGVVALAHLAVIAPAGWMAHLGWPGLVVAVRSLAAGSPCTGLGHGEWSLISAGGLGAFGLTVSVVHAGLMVGLLGGSRAALRSGRIALAWWTLVGAALVASQGLPGVWWALPGLVLVGLAASWARPVQVWCR